MIKHIFKIKLIIYFEFNFLKYKLPSTNLSIKIINKIFILNIF